MARKQRGSANRRKAKVARAHREIRTARRDFLRKTSTRLVGESDVIAIEDLSVAGMTRSAKGTVDKPGRNVRAKAGLDRAVVDAALGEFRRQLEYETARAGKTLLVLDRWYPSSKTCSHCEHLPANLKLSVRHWSCPACGTRHDRDVNAACNILAAGLAVAACGDGAGPARRQPGRQPSAKRGTRPASPRLQAWERSQLVVIARWIVVRERGGQGFSAVHEPAVLPRPAQAALDEPPARRCVELLGAVRLMSAWTLRWVARRRTVLL